MLDSSFSPILIRSPLDSIAFNNILIKLYEEVRHKEEKDIFYFPAIFKTEEKKFNAEEKNDFYIHLLCSYDPASTKIIETRTSYLRLLHKSKIQKMTSHEHLWYAAACFSMLHAQGISEPPVNSVTRIDPTTFDNKGFPVHPAHIFRALHINKPKEALGIQYFLLKPHFQLEFSSLSKYCTTYPTIDSMQRKE